MFLDRYISRHEFLEVFFAPLLEDPMYIQSNNGHHRRNVELGGVFIYLVIILVGSGRWSNGEVIFPRDLLEDDV
jgi:hypothetical protein